jgi:hypothetical protein
MSIKIMNRVWSDSKQKGSALLLLLAIADNCNDDGIGFPGIAYLANKTRMSDRQTQRLIQYLDSTNELAVVWAAGRGKSHFFYVLSGLPENEISEKKAKAKKVNDERGNGDKMSPIKTVKGDKLAPENAVKGDIFGVKGDIAMSPEPLTVLTVKEPEESGANISPHPGGEGGKKLMPAGDAWAMVRPQLDREMVGTLLLAHVKALAPVSAACSGSHILFRLKAPTKDSADLISSRLGTKISRLLEYGVYSQPVDLEIST